MNTEAKYQVCPLCKTPASVDNRLASTPTRLCEECRALVCRMLPGAHVLADSSTLTFSDIEPAAIGITAHSEDVSADTDEQPLFQEYNNEAEPEPIFYASEGPQISQDETVSSDVFRTPPDDLSPVGYGQGETVENSPLLDTQTEAARSDMIVTDQAQGVDPWEDPLPAWDYSRNEYPILLNPSSKSKSARVWIVGAIILLLALIAVGYSLLSYSDSGEETTRTAVTPDDAKNALITHAEVQNTPQPEDTAAAHKAMATPPEGATQPENAKNPSVETDQKDISAKGNYSLQAMSSKDEKEANQLAERLKTAGVPAYVTSAEIGTRGRWYRVRVGRFVSQEEAKRFAAEYETRVKSGNVGAKFIICNYEKP